jgi:hypothetical protein
MGISSPIHTLEIIGNEATSILKLNHTDMTSKGSRDYILSVRDELLTNRGYIVPDDWDLKWNVHLGPIWTPARLTTTELKCWLSPEYLHPSATVAEDIAEAEDRSGNGIKFENLDIVTGQPHFSSALNGYTGMDFNGSTQLLYSDDEAGDDEFDIGTDDFYFVLMLKYGGTQAAQERYILCSDNSKDFAISVDSSGTFNVLACWFGGTEYSTLAGGSAAWSNDSYGILGGGRISTIKTLRTSDTTSNLILGANTSSIANAEQFFLGAQEGSTDKQGAPRSFWNGELFEVLFYHGTITDDIRQKMEGYLAHKYDQLGLLESSHPYKSNPPRSKLQE